MHTQSEQSPLYQTQVNFPTFVRGDTMPYKGFTIRNGDGTAVIPDQVRAKMKGRTFGDTHDLPVTIENSGRVILGGLAASETESLQPQIYYYDVEFTIGEKVRTYVSGMIKVAKDITV